jgi:hypothetical protein
MLEMSVRMRKLMVIWGLVGCALPIFWGILGFIFFNARESTWTDIYWYAVYISCPPWLLSETRISWLITPLLNGVLYAGVVLLISRIRRAGAGVQ